MTNDRYQCPEFDWCENGDHDYPCRGDHFAQVCFTGTMSVFKKGRVIPGVGVIVGTSFTPTDDVVPLISITIGDSTQVDMSLPEAKVAVTALNRAIEIATPFWDARPDVLAVYAEVVQ